MGLGKWFTDLMSVPVENDETEAQEQQPTEQKEESTSQQSRFSFFNSNREQPAAQTAPASNIKVVLAKPETFEDGRSVADHLNQKRTVVLNLENVETTVSRRLIDFLTGVAYANGGEVKRVANRTYIITPNSVDVMGDLILDELEDSGLYMNF